VRILELAASNEPPLDHEASAIQSLVEKPSVRLASLDSEILRLKDRLRRLEEEREALSQCHSQHTAILSPLRRMPYEILCEIFSCIRPTSRVVLGIGNCPWVLTHVCRRWRVVALSKPSLWSLICI
ncbi:hypothetical protein C8R45DRAFT_790336, partial [Mycena sanguinolenta]